MGNAYEGAGAERGVVMKFQAVKHMEHSVRAFEEHETIPVGAICDFIFDGIPVITYKGKMICDYDSDMVKEYFKQI